MYRAILAAITAIILLLAFAGTALATDPLGYEEIKLRGRVMTDQVNQVRSPDLHHRYSFSKVAYRRSLSRAIERDNTGTSEFGHNLDHVQKYLHDNDICYHWVGEVVGFSNTLPTSSLAATADGIIDRWETSPTHNSLIKNTSGDWGGGSFVKSNSGTYFFAYYVADICGI